MKTCKGCNRELEEKSFVAKGNGVRAAICYNCKYKRKSDEYKFRKRGKKYGYAITKDEYEKLFKLQNGVCAICKTNDDKRSLAVDHNHITGKIRGLLCIKCNVVLGIMKDSPDILRAASHYLLDED